MRTAPIDTFGATNYHRMRWLTEFAGRFDGWSKSNMDHCGRSLPAELEKPAEQFERLLRIHEQVPGQAGVDMQRKAISKFPLANLPEIDGLDGTDVVPRANELHACFLKSADNGRAGWLPSLSVQELKNY